MKTFLHFIALFFITIGYGQGGAFQSSSGHLISPAPERVYIDSNFIINSLVPLGTLYFTIDFYEVKLLKGTNQISIKGKFCYHSSTPDCFGLGWVSLFLAKRKKNELVKRVEIVNILNEEEIENGLFDVQIDIKGNKNLYFYMPYFMSFQLDLKQLKKELKKP